MASFFHLLCRCCNCFSAVSVGQRQLRFFLQGLLQRACRQPLPHNQHFRKWHCCCWRRFLCCLWRRGFWWR